MKAGYVAVLVAIAAAAAATLELTDPFIDAMHTWAFALVSSLAAVFLLIVGGATALGIGGSRPAALASLGGAVLAASVAIATLLVGAPARVPAVPGQIYRPPGTSSIAVEYPAVPESPLAATDWPSTVTIDDGARRIAAGPGDLVRAGAYVFKVVAGPAAVVDARAPSGADVTITQPDSPAFLSRVLTFIGADLDQPEDYFALPALHREVQVDYYAGLPSHHIDIPFLALSIAEENGGALYQGVAVSGRPIQEAGVRLTFLLGTYPVLTASGEPPLVPYFAGLAMVAAGVAGYAISLARTDRTPSAAEEAR